MRRSLAVVGVVLAACGGTAPKAPSGNAAVTMAALVDHHVHLLNVGYWLLNDRDSGRLFLDLTRVTSLDTLEALVRERTRSLPESQWIVGAGWSPANWSTQALPTHEVLTRAAPPHPVLLARTDGHAGWVNVKRALDAYAIVGTEFGELPPGTLRLEHFSYVREEDFTRAVSLGVTLSIQSNFNSAAGDSPTFAGLRVGGANEPRVYAWRKLFDLQARLVEGSDYFARPAEPLAGFLAAMTRHNSVGLGHDHPATRAAVYRMHMSTTDADSVTWTDHPLSAPLARLSTTRARRTVSAGRTTWKEDQTR